MVGVVRGFSWWPVSPIVVVVVVSSWHVLTGVWSRCVSSSCSIVRAFLIEEQKIVKAVMRARSADEKK